MPRSAALPCTVLLASTFVLAACDRAPESPAMVPAPAAAPVFDDTAAAPNSEDRIDATAVVDRAAGPQAPEAFDVRAFAGTFAADGARLVLVADGSYTWSATGDTGDAATGTWTIEAEGSELRLDPDSKTAPDRLFSLRSSDELVAADEGLVLLRDDR